MKDAEHPFFQPLWRRVAVVAICLVWSAVEWWSGETLWGAITLAISAWGIWVFFVTFEKSERRSDTGTGTGEK